MSKPFCLISGPVFNRSGYGDWATDIAKSLIRYDKYDISIAPQRWGNCQSKRFLEDLNDEDKVVASKILKGPLDRQPDLFIQLSIPNEFQRVGKYNIGMTAGIETDICSGEFIEGVNRVDLTIALSNHAKNVFVNTKTQKQFPDGRKEEIEVKKPIEVCFWGANTNVFNNTPTVVDTIEDVMKNIPEDFAFLFVGQWTHPGLYNDRKDIGNLIKAFCETFNNESDKKPCLILKTSGTGFSTPDRFEILNKIRKIRKSIKGKCPNVYLLHGELKETEMNALFNHSKIKCHISFTHGEGYGHPLLLQTLSGKPLFVPNWSGHLDFLNPDYANLLPGTLTPLDPKSLNQWLIKESKWFTVSYNLAKDKIKSFYYNYNSNKKIKENAELLRKENEEKFSLSAMDKRFWEILEKYVPTFSVENKFILPKLKMTNDTSTNLGENKITLPKLKLTTDSDLAESKIVLPKLKVM